MRAWCAPGRAGRVAPTRDPGDDVPLQARQQHRGSAPAVAIDALPRAAFIEMAAFRVAHEATNIAQADASMTCEIL